MGRILVIGAKGMLGRDLIEVLQSSFCHDEVIGWDLEEIDIREGQETIEKVEGLRPEIVIDVAAYTDVDGCEGDAERAFSVNAEGVRHIALGALRSHAKVVYLSTDYVFDGQKREPYLEHDPPHPINIYGRSKLKGEQYIQELVREALIVRTQWLYGRHGKNFVTSVLRQAREKGTLSIVHDQIGSPTYTTDLSKAITVLIQRDAFGIFHVTNSDPCTWYTFGQTVLNLSGMAGVKMIPISSKELGRPAVRPSYSVLNTQKFIRETGMSLRPWSEALKDYFSQGTDIF
ncbi:MAG: dTDP-4-dehydrorhamnose reductase [Deltaproteobacteria bacterium RBG_13_47_9]|nr:MAG: dTDP-4-dehydrorhamnose reductase [Deltaproteobacteria bacterium RBG_13_47_9]